MCKLNYELICKLSNSEGLWIISVGLTLSIIFNLTARLPALINTRKREAQKNKEEKRTTLALSTIAGIAISTTLINMIIE